MLEGNGRIKRYQCPKILKIYKKLLDISTRSLASPDTSSDFMVCFLWKIKRRMSKTFTVIVNQLDIEDIWS